WLFTSAAVFAEEHVQISGRKLSLASKDSVAFAMARTHNLFDYAQLAPARTFITLGQTALDPEQRRELSRTEGYRELRRDPRLRSAHTEHWLPEASESGGWQAALRNVSVMALLQDRQAVAPMGQSLQAMRGLAGGRQPDAPGGRDAPSQTLDADAAS